MRKEEIKVLVACEESQAVCKAFRALGINAYSCDIQECSGGHTEWHIQGDALVEAYSGKYNIMIGHPPCTYLSYAAMASWNNPGRVFKIIEALMFFAKLWEAPIPHICLENPRGCASPVIAKYTQIIQPYYFGDEFSKTTWLWLKNLPKLTHNQFDNLFESKTHVGKGEFVQHMQKNGKIKKDAAWNYLAPSKERGKFRSKTFPGIAQAMAEQWTKYLLEL